MRAVLQFLMLLNASNGGGGDAIPANALTLGGEVLQLGGENLTLGA